MVVRMLTEWTSTDQTGTMDQTSISEGIGGVVVGNDATASTQGTNVGYQGLVNTRQNYIQGVDNTTNSGTYGSFLIGKGFGAVPNYAQQFSGATTTGGKTTTRRYQVNFALGLFTQDKLVSYLFL
jgi:hypothetical protein